VCVTCAAQQTTPAQEVHIEISVALDSELRNLDGHMHVTYTNQTNDTLDFLWFHIWPNAFKNDRTAYSEHLLRNGRTDFYFSNKKHRGYINRLIFKSGSNVLEQEDHPVHIDILKIKLDTPLVPGGKKVIS